MILIKYKNKRIEIKDLILNLTHIIILILLDLKIKKLEIYLIFYSFFLITLYFILLISFQIC
jgi:hypothetical protein